MLGRNSQNKANVFSIHVLLRSGAEIWSFRRLSGYELDGNEMFLRYASSGDWGGLILMILSSFGVVLMSCRVNFQVVRSALHYSACRI